jgi:hypothetical protein
LFLFPLRSHRLAKHLGSKIVVLDPHFHLISNEVWQPAFESVACR